MRVFIRRGWVLGLALSLGAMRLWGQIDVDHVISIGRNALYFNDYVVSIGYFNQAIDARPFLAMPYYYRAVGKISLEDYSGAAEDAAACIERNPFISKAYLVRGIARQNLGHPTEAIEDYQLGLELEPNNLGMRLNQALAYSQLKRFDEAERSLDTLLRYTPKNTDAYALRMNIALERGDTTLALTRAEEVLRLDSLLASPYRLIAHIASDKEDYPTALKALDKAISLEPDDASLLTNRGVLYYRSNRLREAMKDYSEALRLEPKNKVARYNRAILRTLVGELEPALQDWNIVIAAEPQNHIARYNRASVSERTGHLREALNDLNIVLEQYPAFIDGFRQRSILRKALGDHRGAERDYWHAWDLQNNKQYRTSAHASAINQKQRATRSVEDTSIDKYNMLIEERQTGTTHKAKYSSTARGRVQDRDIQVVPQPAYYLTYFSQINSDGKPHSSALHSDVILEEVNRLDKSIPALKLYSTAYTLDRPEIDSLQRMIQAEMSAPGALDHLQYGIVYSLLQDYEQAILHLSKAIEVRSDFALAYLARAYALQRKQEAEQHREAPNDFAQSFKAVLTASSTTTSDYSTPTGSTIITTPTALGDLNSTIKYAPNFPHGYYNRALLWGQLGETEKAIADYSTAIDLSPRMGEAYFNRGLLYLSSGKHTEGISDLSRAGELGLYQAYNIIKRMNQ